MPESHPSTWREFFAMLRRSPVKQFRFAVLVAATLLPLATGVFVIWMMSRLLP